VVALNVANIPDHYAKALDQTTAVMM